MTPTCAADTVDLGLMDLGLMDLGLKDRVAAVAASNRGLGSAVAMGLATIYIADVALAVDGGKAKGVY